MLMWGAIAILRRDIIRLEILDAEGEMIDRGSLLIRRFYPENLLVKLCEGLGADLAPPATSPTA